MPIQFNSFTFPSGVQRLTGLRTWPIWARSALLIAALPGLVIAALSLLLIVVSILALSLLALPTYVAITRLLAEQSQPIGSTPGSSPGAKRVEVTVLE